MSNFIYSVRATYGGKLKLARAQVVKRTKAQLHIKPDNDQAFAFRYNTRCGLDAYAQTPDEAIRRFREATSERISDLANDLREAQLQLTETPESMF